MRFSILLFFLSLFSFGGFAEVTVEHKKYMAGFIEDLEEWNFPSAEEPLSDNEIKDRLVNCRYKDSLLDRWLPEYSDRNKCSFEIVHLLSNGLADYEKIKSTVSDLHIFSAEEEERIETPVVW